MSYFIVDVEADGLIPPDYSMVCFGAVLFDDRLETTFYGKVRPISNEYPSVNPTEKIRLTYSNFQGIWQSFT